MIKDCTNCLNRDRCFVKGGYGDRCTNVAKGYVHGEWLNAPAETTLEHWRQMTDENDHTTVRREICDWLMGKLRKGMPNNVYRRADDFHRVFTAIKVLHDEVGSLLPDLYRLRHEKTEELIAFIREMNPEAADAINDTL